MWFEVGTKPEEEWPLTKNAAWEQAPEPEEAFDFEAKPSRFYIDVEAVGSVPPKDIINKGLDLLIYKLEDVRNSLEQHLQARPVAGFDQIGGQTVYGGGRTTYGTGTTPFGAGATAGGATPGWGGGRTPRAALNL